MILVVFIRTLWLQGECFDASFHTTTSNSVQVPCITPKNNNENETFRVQQSLFAEVSRLRDEVTRLQEELQQQQQQQGDKKNSHPPNEETKRAAICYAKRNIDLWEGYCESSESNNKCRIDEIIRHYAMHGVKEGRPWGCLQEGETEAAALPEKEGKNKNSNNTTKYEMMSSQGDIPIAGIHGCTRMTLRYEAQHVISWLYYHKSIGVSFFHLYYDSITSNLTNPVERKAYDLLQQLPYVKLWDIVEHGFGIDQLKALGHCPNQVDNQGRRAEWVIQFDVDEFFAFGSPVTQKPDCDSQRHLRHGALLQFFVEKVPADVDAVVLPRLTFGSSNITTPPPERNRQMQLYVQHKGRYADMVGKVMYRPHAKNMGPMRGQHHVTSQKGKTLKVIYPTGQLVPPKEEPCGVEGPQRCSYFANEILYKFHGPNAAALRLHHYESRSYQECMQKVFDFKNTEGFQQNWRAILGNWMCDIALLGW